MSELQAYLEELSRTAHGNPHEKVSLLIATLEACMDQRDGFEDADLYKSADNAALLAILKGTDSERTKG